MIHPRLFLPVSFAAPSTYLVSVLSFSCVLVFSVLCFALHPLSLSPPPHSLFVCLSFFLPRSPRSDRTHSKNLSHIQHWHRCSFDLLYLFPAKPAPSPSPREVSRRTRANKYAHTSTLSSTSGTAHGRPPCCHDEAARRRGADAPGRCRRHRCLRCAGYCADRHDRPPNHSMPRHL